MFHYMTIDSEYCSMGRWISIIVGHYMNMKLYEGKDLVALAEEPWLTEEYLADFDQRLATMSIEEIQADEEMKRVHQALTKAILKAVELGPCIFHERAASEILKGRDDCLKAFLYNTNVEHKIPRARADKSYPIEHLSHDELIAFIKQEDYKRSSYHDSVASFQWGDKAGYDICLDSDMLSREKCAEILIETLRDVSLDDQACADIIKQTFTWMK